MGSIGDKHKIEVYLYQRQNDVGGQQIGGAPVDRGERRALEWNGSFRCASFLGVGAEQLVAAMIRELLAVAARAALEWALATLLLANGAAFCLIAAAAARLRLGPPCILCARVHRLPCSASASGGEERGAMRLLLCDAHLAAVAADPDRHHEDAGKGGLTEAGDPADKVSGLETHRVVSIGSEICEQDRDVDDVGQPRATGRSRIARTNSTEDGGSGLLVSLFELAPIVAQPRGGGGGDSSVDPATAPELVAVDGGERLTVGQVVSALRDQRQELEALRAELAAERRARAEAEEYQRQLEEQGELDREAARLAMQLVHESETEKHGLQRQLDACRVRAQLETAAADDSAGVEGCFRRGANGAEDGNNYQSLVDFLPGSVYSSSPDLANLLKLYTESGNGGGRRRQRDDHDEPAVAVVEEEAEEEEEVMAVAVTVTAATESSGNADATTAIVAESLHERSTNSCHIETVAEAS
ncbi:hypothetical protein C2845_PM05G17950 [Panicum miliaceum]|uniref:GTD-binding domain-containing protein n=1 Tax=Panicum miliaceum TaxID=4540 RepID=A0A3L6T1G4_PANMI|nr:hypothetical protein C2845_PM05G17950 [Panicum miliaceum]